VTTAEVESDQDWSAPAHDNLAECCALGAMMMSPAIADTVGEILTAADFYKPMHGAIFAAIGRLAATGRPIDGATVAAELADSGDLVRIGGVPYLHTLIESVPTPANGPYYALKVADASRRRRIVEAGLRIVQLGRSESAVGEVAEQAQEAIHAATTDPRDRTVITSIGDLAEPTLRHIEDVADGKIPPGIPTGFKDYDRLTGGHRPGQLIIPAGRTSMGKSVWTQNVVAHCAQHVVRPVILFSNEMPELDMMMRFYSEVARVPLHKILHGTIDGEDRAKLRDARDLVLTWPLYVVDTCRTIPSIRAYLRRFTQKHGDLALFAVDYLQMISPVATGGRRPDRHVEVGSFARDLKVMAVDLQAVCVAPCQLNRGTETRGGKNANVPRLSDLRESGDLEQTADNVILLYRPSYYDKQSPRTGEADFIIAKHRHGATDTVTVAEQLHLMRFVDMAIVEPRSWE
jgi:replicative DNA helicase